MKELIIILFFISIIFITFIIFYINKKDIYAWNCTKSGCSLEKNGKYVSEDKCKEDCESSNKLKAWSCVNCNCVESEQGFTSKELCQENCNCMNNYYQNIEIPYTYLPYRYQYYPQSLYYRDRYPRHFRRWYNRYHK